MAFISTCLYNHSFITGDSGAATLFQTVTYYFTELKIYGLSISPYVYSIKISPLWGWNVHISRH
jgi:hypothetical protein